MKNVDKFAKFDKKVRIIIHINLSLIGLAMLIVGSSMLFGWINADFLTRYTLGVSITCLGLIVLIAGSYMSTQAIKNYKEEHK